MKRCGQGQGTDLEKILYLGRQKNEIVHQLFNRDLIETKGIFRISGDSGSGQRQLVAMIATTLNKDIQIVETIIRGIVSAGYLKSETTDGHMKWFWTHNNKVEQSPTMLKN